MDAVHCTEYKGCVAACWRLGLQLGEFLLLGALALQSLLGAFIELTLERGVFFGFGGGCSELAKTGRWARP